MGYRSVGKFPRRQVIRSYLMMYILSFPNPFRGPTYPRPRLQHQLDRERSAGTAWKEPT